MAHRRSAILRALKSKLNRSSRELTGERDQQPQPASATATNCSSPTSRFGRLIVQLKDLEKINEIHARHIDWLRNVASLASSSIRLPTLFSEIFDIQMMSSKSSTASSCVLSSSIEDSSDESCDTSAGSLAYLESGGCGGRDIAANQKQLAICEPRTTQDARQDDLNHLGGCWSDLGPTQLNQRDLFFELEDSDDKIDDAADLKPTVDCLDL